MKLRFVPVLTLVFTGAAVAQETTGEVRGSVRDVRGDPFAGALVTATGRSLLGTRRATTAGDGIYRLPGLPPGLYELRVQAIGHRLVLIDSVRVRLGGIAQAPEVRLDPAIVALEPARIVATAMALDPARTTIGATIEASDHAALPGERDYKSLMSILPHANTSYHGDAVNVGGSTGLENLYYIDGVNVTSPFKAASATSLPYNFVRSVEVRAGGYEAQYGGALGAIVNAVTYTGSNETESTVFGFGTHDALIAAPKAEQLIRQTGSYSYDVGARLSGPVLRDRLWYSAAYNPRLSRSRRHVAALGAFPDEFRADLFAGKLTWRPAEASTIELSLFGDPAARQGVAYPPLAAGFTPTNADPLLYKHETGGTNASLRTTTSVASWLLLDASVSRATIRDNHVARTTRGRDDTYYQDNIARTISGGMPWPSTVDQAISSAVVRASVSRGRHGVVAGAEYEVSRITRVPNVRILVRQDTALYRLHVEQADGAFRNVVPTLYLQDSWRASERLTLNAGLRWSRQSLIGASGNVAQRLADEWQPRTGFSLQLGSASMRRMFGSYGRFYQRVPLNLPSLFYVRYFEKDWHYTTDPRLGGATAIDSSDFTAPESDFTGKADGMHAEHFDEVSLGYEQLVRSRARLTVRAMRRQLRSTFQTGIDASCPTFYCLGTPGRGALSFLPRPERDYRAVELSLEGAWRAVLYRTSYVLSRTWGNYPGLFGSDFYFANPGILTGLSKAHQAVNSTGRLPNDRPHAFKLAATANVVRAMTVGTLFTWQSGTPINELGVGPDQRLGFPSFLVPRGSAGRLPAIVDASVRGTWTLRDHRNAPTRVVVDVLHIGNVQQTTRVDQQRYFGMNNGNPSNPNPNYLRPIGFAPPTTVNIGLEVALP